MADRVNAGIRERRDIRVIDPETGQLKRTVRKSYPEFISNSPMEQSQIAQQSPQVDPAKEAALQNLMQQRSPTSSQPVSSPAMNPVQPQKVLLNKQHIQQIGQDIENSPEKYNDIKQYYKDHGIDLDDPEVSGEIQMEMEKRGFDPMMDEE